MNKKIIFPMIGAWLAACASAAAAQEASAPKQVVVPHWYAGAALGRTILDLPDEAMPVAGTSTINKGRQRTGYKFFAGYRLHRNFALEAAYADYGEFTVTRPVTAPASGSLKADIKMSGWSLEGVGILPFDSGFSVYAKLGALYTLTNTTFSTEGGVAAPAAPNQKSREVTVKSGIGLAYAFTERVSLRLEYEVAKKVGEESTVEGDVKAMFGGLQCRF